MHNLTALLTGKQKQGATVELTISPAAQNAAYQALTTDGGHAAAVVAIQPSTGAILALASYPTFNPNELTTFDGAKLNKVDERLLTERSQPLLNRAITGDLPARLVIQDRHELGVRSPSTRQRAPATLVPAPSPLHLPNGHHLVNDGGEICGDGHPPIIQAFWMSCNTAFGALGIKLTAPVLRSYSSQFGMNKPLSIPLPVVPSVMPEVQGWTDPSLTAFSAIGQFNDAVTPLQEAMFSAAVANHGTLMHPYMVQQVVGPGLSVIDQAKASVLSQAVKPTVAGYMQSMMYPGHPQPRRDRLRDGGPAGDRRASRSTARPARQRTASTTATSTTPSSPASCRAAAGSRRRSPSASSCRAAGSARTQPRPSPFRSSRPTWARIHDSTRTQAAGQACRTAAETRPQAGTLAAAPACHAGHSPR